MDLNTPLIYSTAKDVDLALLSMLGTRPAGHTFSPAQRLLGRVLRNNLPQPISTLEPRQSLHDIVVSNQLHHKLIKNDFKKKEGMLLVMRRALGYP